MDNQKQIEEMAKELCPHYDKGNCYYDVTEVCECCFGCEFCWAVSQVLSAGYRKIPEGSVVLTREEYERLLKEETLCERLGNDIDLKLKYIYELEDKVAQLRKETSEKFAKLADDKSVYFIIDGTIYKAVHFEDIVEICKEITEGEV